MPLPSIVRSHVCDGWQPVTGRQRAAGSTGPTAIAIGLALLLAACDGDGTDSPLSPSNLPTLTVQDLISAVEIQGVQATARPGLAPAPGAGSPVNVSGNPNVVNGGTLSATVAGTAPFQTMYVFVASQTSGLATVVPGGVDGYYELRLPSPLSNAVAVLAFAQIDSSPGAGPHVRRGRRLRRRRALRAAVHDRHVGRDRRRPGDAVMGCGQRRGRARHRPRR